jgi:hypothetical protein
MRGSPHLHPLLKSVYLWLCTDQSPKQSETYLNDDPHCRIKGTYRESFTIRTASHYATKYVPPGTGTNGLALTS